MVMSRTYWQIYKIVGSEREALYLCGSEEKAIRVINALKRQGIEACYEVIPSEIVQY